MKSIYNMRWGIETSFRALKYTVGLTNFHAKRQDSIIQEIFAKMIMYNFTEMITSRVVISQIINGTHIKSTLQSLFMLVDISCAYETMNPHPIWKR
ncbi:transposase [Paenibacillus sp. Marseille-Q7038]